MHKYIEPALWAVEPTTSIASLLTNRDDTMTWSSWGQGRSKLQKGSGVRETQNFVYF